MLLIGAFLAACTPDTAVLRCEGEGCGCSTDAECTISDCGMERAEESTTGCEFACNCLGGWPMSLEEDKRRSAAFAAECSGLECRTDCASFDCSSSIGDITPKCQLGRCVGIVELVNEE